MSKTTEERLTPNGYNWVRACMQGASKYLISDVLNEPKPKTFGVTGGVFRIVREEPNKNCILTVNMTTCQNDREDIMELAIYSLNSGKIALMKHSGLEPEELATLNQLCLNYGVETMVELSGI